jgi:FtsP/CotA-like multicopper oxidase with cupredoxin domain
LASLGIDASQPAWAQNIPTKLVIDRRTLEVLGRPASVYGIRQLNGTSGIVLGPGQPFIVDLENRLTEETIIHWHGQTPPYPQDGVVSEGNPSLLAGATRRYDFAPRSGTHWMHSHIGLQEQLLLAAPMIIRTTEEVRADVQETIVLLADFTFRDPAELLDDLQRGKKSHDMPGMSAGSKPTPAMPGMESMPGMPAAAQKAASAPDLNDVEYDAFLANDRTLEDPQIIAVERGGRVRLRIINGATTSAFHIDLGRLDGTLVAVDGNAVQPILGRRFGVAVAQRLDILVALPRDPGAYPILAQREGDIGRTGLVLATPGARVEKISPRAEASAPAVDLSLEEKLIAIKPLAERPADIIHQIALTGDMSKYIWSIDDRVWDNHRPLKVKLGQRVVVEMRNTTMMPHPMHLHGHHFQVIGINGRALRGAVRDTVLVPPDTSVSIAFDADNAGRWFFHCHNLFHRDVGMQTEISYEA